MQYYIKPWDHQTKAINKSLELNDMALFWEMGTGKTATLINVCRQKYSKNLRMMRTLILAPKVVLTNWKHEFLTHSPKTNPNLIIVFNDDSMKKKKAKFKKFFTSNFVMVINYEAMQDEEFVAMVLAWRPETVPDHYGRYAPVSPRGRC